MQPASFSAALSCSDLTSWH